MGLGSQYSSVKLKRVPDPAQLPNATLLRGDRLFVFLCTLPRFGTVAVAKLTHVLCK